MKTRDTAEVDRTGFCGQWAQPEQLTGETARETAEGEDTLDREGVRDGHGDGRDRVAGDHDRPVPPQAVGEGTRREADQQVGQGGRGGEHAHLDRGGAEQDGGGRRHREPGDLGAGLGDGTGGRAGAGSRVAS